MTGREAVIIGAGPAGLMAAETLAQAGASVAVYDAMPTPGRKFLRAGIGGLNLTHGEDYAAFCARYGDRRLQLQPMLDGFPPQALRAWAHGLGVETFVGSSGRVFPVGMKASPLLRAWLHRLHEAGVRFHMRHRWLGWNADGSLRLANPQGEMALRPYTTLLATGGASWPQLGSDAAWVPWLRAKGVEIADFESANCGFDIAWSDYLREKFAGTPLKAVALIFTGSAGETQRRQGELVISRQGVEGSLIYAFSRPLRESIKAQGQAVFHLDLLPAYDHARVLAEVSHPRGSRSLSSHLQSRLGLGGVKLALLHEVLDKTQLADAAMLATTIKALPLTARAARPVAEAISSAGGVCFASVDERLMLKELPSVFVAGEMLDWEAPTGGYLLTACFATGLWAGQRMCEYLQISTGRPA